jgi:molybdopterin molybdotransferase
MNDGMISVEEARGRILAVVERLPAVAMPLAEALGQVLAEDVTSPITIPPLDNTAMDGYAVRAADTDGATPDSPVTLRVIGEVAAGYIYDGEVEPGTAVRIMTGAPIPRGADSVVPFEETDETAGRVFGRFAKGRDHVGVFKAALPGNNVRRAGEDVKAGTIVLRAGTELHAAQIGVLASLGNADVSVYRRRAARARQDLRRQQLQRRRTGHGGRGHREDRGHRPRHRGRPDGEDSGRPHGR